MDLIASRAEPHARKATFVEKLTLKRAARYATHIFTISDSTKQDLLAHVLQLYPSRIVMIHAGPMRENPPQGQSDGKTILCAATLCPRKNQERLIRAYSSLPESL